MILEGAIIFIKQTFENWKQRIVEIREKTLATKGRTLSFQIMVTALLVTALTCITWYLFKIII